MRRQDKRQAIIISLQMCMTYAGQGLLLNGGEPSSHPEGQADRTCCSGIFSAKASFRELDVERARQVVAPACSSEMNEADACFASFAKAPPRRNIVDIADKTCKDLAKVNNPEEVNRLVLEKSGFINALPSSFARPVSVYWCVFPSWLAELGF